MASAVRSWFIAAAALPYILHLLTENDIILWIYIQYTQKYFLIIRSSFYKETNSTALEWQKSAWSDAHKKANCVMGAEDLPTQSQGQTAMKAVNGPRISSLVLTHTLHLFDVSFWVLGSEWEG